MAKKKIKPSDLDLTPKATGAISGMIYSYSNRCKKNNECTEKGECKNDDELSSSSENPTPTRYIPLPDEYVANEESNDLHCVDTIENKCNATDCVDCLHTHNNLCGNTNNKCPTFHDCLDTNLQCADTKTSAGLCCAHTGNDCMESGTDCDGTYKDCTLNLCGTMRCQTEWGCGMSTRCLSDNCAVATDLVECATGICHSENVCPISENVDECPDFRTIYCLPILSDENCEATGDCITQQGGICNSLACEDTNE